MRLYACATLLIAAQANAGVGVSGTAGPLHGQGFDGARSEVTPPSDRAGLERTIEINAASWDTMGDPDNTVLLIDMASLFGFAPGSTMPLTGLG